MINQWNTNMKASNSHVQNKWCAVWNTDAPVSNESKITLANILIYNHPCPGYHWSECDTYVSVCFSLVTVHVPMSELPTDWKTKRQTDGKSRFCNMLRAQSMKTGYDAKVVHVHDDINGDFNETEQIRNASKNQFMQNLAAGASSCVNSSIRFCQHNTMYSKMKTSCFSL